MQKEEKWVADRMAFFLGHLKHDMPEECAVEGINQAVAMIDRGEPLGKSVCVGYRLAVHRMWKDDARGKTYG